MAVFLVAVHSGAPVRRKVLDAFLYVGLKSFELLAIYLNPHEAIVLSRSENLDHLTRRNGHRGMMIAGGPEDHHFPSQFLRHNPFLRCLEVRAPY